MATRPEWFWGLILEALLQIGCVESNPGPNEGPEESNIRRRYGSFDDRSKALWSQEEPPKEFYVCWPWNWWCRRGDLPEEDERLIHQTTAKRFDVDESSDDELLRDHVVSQEDIATTSYLPEPNSDAAVLRVRVDQLEQQLKREQQQKRCYEDKIEQLRQLYESARATQLQEIQEQSAAQQQALRLRQLEHQLQQNVLERKSLEEALLKETEGRQRLEDLFRAQILDKELQLQSHLEEEEIQRRRLQQDLSCEQEKRKSVENLLEKTELQKLSLQKRCNDLELQLDDEVRRRVETEKELLLTQTSEQELQLELRDIRKYHNKTDKASNTAYCVTQYEEQPIRNDTTFSEKHTYSSEEIYWSIPENDGIFDDKKLTESQPMSKKQENEELRNMLERSIEEKILLQRLLQKELMVRKQIQIRAKKDLKLQRKIMEAEFRKELGRIEEMFPIDTYSQYNEKNTSPEDKNVALRNDDKHSTTYVSSDSISITSEIDTDENVSTEDESDEEAVQTDDVISDVIAESVDEEERQEIRQLLLEELQRLQAHVKEEQELKRKGRMIQENVNCRELKEEEQEITSSEISDHNSVDLEKEKILGENIEAILRKHPFKSENEELFNDNKSKTSESEILSRSNMSDEASPLFVTTVETKENKFTNTPSKLSENWSSVGSVPTVFQSGQEKGPEYLGIVKSVIFEKKHKYIASESDPLVTEQMLQQSEQEFTLHNEEKLDSYSSKVTSGFASDDVELHKLDAVQGSEYDGLTEQIIARSRTLNKIGFDKHLITDQKIFDISVHFQGHHVSLRALLENEDPDYELLRLLQNYSKEPISVSPLPSIVLSNQIRRSILRKIYLKQDILKHKFSKLRTTFAISGASKEELLALIPSDETVERLKESGVEKPARNFVILDDTTAESDYEELCSKAQNLRDIHWLHKDLGQGILMWKKSRSSIKDIRKYIDTQISNIYSSLADVNERCSVISASSGQGSSTFMNQVVNDFKESDATYWIMKLEVSKIKKEIMESCNNQEQVFEILWESNGTSSDLEKKLFEHCFYRTGKIILLLEDVHKNITGSQIFLKALLETKLRRIVITVHPNWQNIIEDCVSSLAFTLTPLNECEQKNIVIQRWNVPEADQKRTEDFCVAVLRSASLGNLTLSPLHLILLADNYKVALEDYLSKSYIDIPAIIDETTLYESCIEIYFEQEILESESQFESRHLRDRFLSSATYYALDLLFPGQNSMFHFSEEQSDTYKLKAKTLHFCVAEYLCAKWFAKHFEEYRSLIRENYCSKKLQRLWFLFDKLLSETSELHLASLYGDISRVEQLLEAGSDIHALNRGGRKSIHIATIHGHVSVVKLLMQKMEKQSAGKDRVLDWTPLRYADESGNWEMVEALLEAGECPSDIEKARESLHDKAKFEVIIIKAVSAGYNNLFRNLLNISEFSVNRTLSLGTYSYQKYTLLHIAAENGRSEVVEYLLRMPVVRTDLEAWDGSTPLHLAARHGHTETVRRLISRTSSLVFNKKGDTPLHEAVRNGHVNVATVLLAESDADPNSRNVAGDCPLHIACSNGDITFVSLLLDYGAEKNISNGNGYTPLHCAIRCGQSTVVRYLVEKCGKDIVIGAGEDKSPGQDSSLHVAASMGDTLSMEYLLKAVGRDCINITNNGGDTPLHFAALHGCSSMVEYLISKCGTNPVQTNRYGNTAVHLAVVRGDYSTVRVLLAHTPAHMDIANCEGNLPLHLAARRGNLQMIRCLLHYDQDKHTVAVKNKEIKTPLQLVIERDNVDIAVIKTFLESNSDVNVRDRHGNTLLHKAVFLARVDIVKLLLDTGLALRELRNSSGDTALLSAVKAGQPEVTFVLAKGGVDVNVRTNDGNPVLHVAVAGGNLETVSVLLEHGAFPDARNAEGNTALHRAIYLKNVGMMRLLLENGADKNSRNLREQSPRDLALHLNAKEDILCYL